MTGYWKRLRALTDELLGAYARRDVRAVEVAAFAVRDLVGEALETRGDVEVNWEGARESASDRLLRLEDVASQVCDLARRGGAGYSVFDAKNAALSLVGLAELVGRRVEKTA